MATFNLLDDLCRWLTSVPPTNIQYLQWLYEAPLSIWTKCFQHLVGRVKAVIWPNTGLDDVASECVEHTVDWSSARSGRNSSLTDLHHFKGMNSNLIHHCLDSGVSRIPRVTFQNRNISVQLCGNLSTVSHYADMQLLCRSLDWSRSKTFREGQFAMYTKLYRL